MSQHDRLPDWAQGLPSILQEYYLAGKLKNADPDFLLHCEPIQDKRIKPKSLDRLIENLKKRGFSALPEATHDPGSEELVDSARWLLGGGGKKGSWSLGSGGMGEVYYGYDTVMENPVAIKILAQGKRDLELPDAIEREAKTIARLSHPCLPRIYEFFVDKGRYMYAMELLDEKKNFKPLSERTGLDGQEPDEMLRTFAGLCDVVDYCWKKKIVHRDLKPSNMMVDDQGNLVVIDFGMSSWVFPGDDSTMFGTPGYISPERVSSRGDSSLTLESEIFTMGTILYEMIADELMYTGGSPMDIALQTYDPMTDKQQRRLRSLAQARGFDPDAIVEIINKAHDKEPKKRFRSGKEFFEALRRARL